MKSNVETLEDNRVKLSIEVDEAELDVAIDAAFRQIAREVKLPGFRQGKAPRKILEARLGKNAGRAQALEDALPDYYAKAVVEHDVDVIASPEIEITTGAEDGPLVFDAVVQIRPSVTVAGYRGMKVEIPNPVPKDEVIEAQIDRMRAQFATLETVDRPAETGDHVTIDISGSIHDEEVPGLTTTGYDYEVGSGAVVKEIDDELIGAVAGDELSFDAEHPDPDEEHQLSFEITVLEVKQTILPDFDDAFAAESSEFETADELRASIVERLSMMQLAQARMALQQATAEALAELVTDDVPEVMIDAEVSARFQDTMQRLQQQGVDLGQYFASSGKSPEEIFGEMREPSEQAVRVDLGLRAVAVAESLFPTPDQVAEEIQRIAEQSGDTVEALEAAIESAGTRSALEADIAKRNALEWLTENVEVVDDEGNPIDRAALEFPEDPASSDDDESSEEEVTDADGEDQ